jgi:hypothetical protein
MNCIVMLFGECLHIIKYDPIDYKNGKAENKLPGSFAGEIE